MHISFSDLIYYSYLSLKLLIMKIRRTFLLIVLASISFLCSTHAQIITTVAGTGVSGFSGDGGAATLAELGNTVGISIDSSGNLYVVDGSNRRVRKITTSGTISTFAGTGGLGYSGDGGPATAAQLSDVESVAVDKRTGNVYTSCFTLPAVRMVNAAGVISTFAGDGVAGNSGNGGPATAAMFNIPGGMAIDTMENVYIADAALTANTVRKVDFSGTITGYAGDGTLGYSGDGGPATSAETYKPNSVATDMRGNIYFSDGGNSVIRKVNAAGIISTVAGTGVSGFSGDGGPATAAQLYYPAGIALDIYGNLYVADERNDRIREIDTAGIITTIAGNGTVGYNGDGCSATGALLNLPFGVAVDGMGNIYITDDHNFRIRRVSRNHIPFFTGGRQQPLSVCRNTVHSINSLLAVLDTDAGQTETWSVVAPPMHGSLSAAFVLSSTGAPLTPSGLYYSSAGYTGTDTFSVMVMDCAGASDTTVVYVTIDSIPDAGAISGADTLCKGATAMLRDVSAGGTWQCINSSVTVSGGLATGVLAGIDTVFYIVGNACGLDSASKQILVRNCPSGVNTVPGGNEDQVSLFPNPNDGTFVVSFASPLARPVLVTVTNLMGEKLKEITADTNSPVQISLHVPPGVYFLDVTSDGGVYKTKLVVGQ